MSRRERAKHGQGCAHLAPRGHQTTHLRVLWQSLPRPPRDSPASPTLNPGSCASCPSTF
ncbi:hypothetical protein BC567DRAFT_223191 [Phyllosticta citribraziliensis]